MFLFDIISNFFTSGKEWNEKGQILFEQGKYDEAIQCFDKAILSGNKIYDNTPGSFDLSDKPNERKAKLRNAKEIINKARREKGLALLAKKECDAGFHELNYSGNNDDLRDSDRVWISLGDILREINYYNLAIIFYEKARLPENWPKKLKKIKETLNQIVLMKNEDQIKKIFEGMANDGIPEVKPKIDDLYPLERITRTLKALNQIPMKNGIDKIDYIDQGNTLYNKGLYNAAFLCYAEAISCDPSDPAGWYNLGLVLDYNYFLEYSLQDSHFIRINSLNSDKPKNYIGINSFKPEMFFQYAKRRWDILQGDGKDNQVIESCNKVLAVNQNCEALCYKGFFLIRNNNYDGAIQCGDAALKIDPQWKEAWRIKALAISAKGETAFNTGNYDDAIQYWVTALDSYWRWNNQLNDSFRTRVEGRIRETWTTKGYVLLAKNQNNEAANCFKKALAMSSKKLTINNDCNKIELVNAGNASYSKGSYEESIRSYELAILRDPEYALAWYNRGLALFCLNNNDGALASYEQALSIDPNYQPAQQEAERVLAIKNMVLKASDSKQQKQSVAPFTNSDSDQTNQFTAPFSGDGFKSSNINSNLSTLNSENNFLTTFGCTQQGFVFFNDLSDKSSLKKDSNTVKNDEKILSINNKEKLLAVIGNSDKAVLQLGNIIVTRNEVESSFYDENSYYTADFINILLYPLNHQNVMIKSYPAIPLESIEDYKKQIQSQTQRYAFVPTNVSYGAESANKNHWVAIIIDRPNQIIFYLDPAKKTDAPQFWIYLGYNQKIFCNPIDFQMKEKKEGWIRHCGVYIIKIFEVFRDYIQKGQCIAGERIPDLSIANSISVQTALSNIPCGEAEIITDIRQKHINEAYSVLIKNQGKVVQKVNVISHPSERLEDITREPNSNEDPQELFVEIRKLIIAYQKLEQQSHNTYVSQITSIEKDKIINDLKALNPLIAVLDHGKFGQGLLGQFYITLRIHLKELFTAASVISSEKVQRAPYLPKDKIKNFLGAFAKGALPLIEALGVASEGLVEIVKTVSEGIHIFELMESISDTAGFDSIIEKGIEELFGRSEEEKLRELSSLIIDNVNQDILMEMIARRLTESYQSVINYLVTQGLDKKGIKMLAQIASQRIWEILRRNPKIKQVNRDTIAEHLVAWVSHYPLDFVDTIKEKLKSVCIPILTLHQGKDKIPLTANTILSHVGVAYRKEETNYQSNWLYYAEKEGSLYQIIGFRKVTSEIGKQIVENQKSFYGKYWKQIIPVKFIIQEESDCIKIKKCEHEKPASKLEVRALESKINQVEKETKKLKKEVEKNSLSSTNNISMGIQMQQKQNIATRPALTDQNKYFNDKLQKHEAQLGFIGQIVAEQEEKIEKLDNMGLHQKSSPLIDRFRQQAVASILEYIKDNKEKIRMATFNFPLSSTPMILFYNKELSEKKEGLAVTLIQELNTVNNLNSIREILQVYRDKDKLKAQSYGKDCKTLTQTIDILLQVIPSELSAEVDNKYSDNEQHQYR